MARTRVQERPVEKGLVLGKFCYGYVCNSLSIIAASPCNPRAPPATLRDSPPESLSYAIGKRFFVNTTKRLSVFSPRLKGLNVFFFFRRNIIVPLEQRRFKLDDRLFIFAMPALLCLSSFFLTLELSKLSKRLVVSLGSSDVR